jgi:glycine betaine transporter
LESKKGLLGNKLLIIGLLFGLSFCFLGFLFPKAMLANLTSLNLFIINVFSTYYLVLALGIVLAALLIVFLPISKKRFGESEPEYSFFSWVALLFSTGMGSGLLLRAVQEPIYYVQHPPVATASTKILALQYTFFHWGFTPWAMYSVFGLIVAYNLYIRKANNIVSAITQNSSIKNVISPFIIVITIAGVVASLGLGTGQFVGGLNQYFELSLGSKSLLFTVFFIGLIGTLSALTGINKVIKYLADFDIAVSLLLMFFVALFLNYSSFLIQTSLSFYNYVLHFFEMSLSFGNYKTSKTFIREWTVFYWAFWLAWVPFTGIFIARISKGRTIREFIIATILVPTVATILWFSIFANLAFDITAKEDPSQFNNIFTSLFVFLKHFPFSNITVLVAACLVLISIINSVDSAIFVLGMFSDDGKENPAKKHKLAWGIIITATAIGLTSLGSNDLLNAISSFLIILALPFSFVYLFLIVSFFVGLVKVRISKSE